MSSPRNRRRLGKAATLIVVVGLGLAACSNSSDDSSADSSEATTATTVAVEPESTEVEDADTVPADTAPADTGATTDTAGSSATSEPEADAGPDLGEFAPISGVPGVTDEAIQYAGAGNRAEQPGGLLPAGVLSRGRAGVLRLPQLHRRSPRTSTGDQPRSR